MFGAQSLGSEVEIVPYNGGHGQANASGVVLLRKHGRPVSGLLVFRNGSPKRHSDLSAHSDSITDARHFRRPNSYAHSHSHSYTHSHSHSYAHSNSYTRPAAEPNARSIANAHSGPATG